MLVETDVEVDTASVPEAKVPGIEVGSPEESELGVTVDPSPVTGPALLLNKVLVSPVARSDELVRGNGSDNVASPDPPPLGPTVPVMAVALLVKIVDELGVVEPGAGEPEVLPILLSVP